MKRKDGTDPSFKDKPAAMICFEKSLIEGRAYTAPFERQMHRIRYPMPCVACEYTAYDARRIGMLNWSMEFGFWYGAVRSTRRLQSYVNVTRL